MSSMSDYRREMEQENFSPEEFVERLAWRTVTSNEFDPEVLHDNFSEAISDLETLLEMQRLKCTQLENGFTNDELLLRNRLSMLLNRNQSATNQLSDLEKKVNFVATKVVHLGDQLESVNLPRERANEAAKLMRHLEDFLQPGPGSILLSDVFRDKENVYEAAEIILKLQMIAQDLLTGGGGSSSNAKFDGAIKKISQKYEEIERSLIEEFVQAQRIDDRDKMKKIAHILYNFKGYSQCINAFIEQSQLGGFKCKDLFDDVMPLCESNQTVINQVFQNPEQVLGKFVLHIFHGKIQETVATQLYDKSEKGGDDKFLKNLFSLYSKTKKLVGQLESFDLGTDSSFLDKITEQIFRKHLESYISVEIKCLQRKANRILSIYYERLGHQKRAVQTSFQDFRRDIQAVLGNRTNINIAQIENFGGETFLSEEVGISLLQESRIANSRCSLLSKKSDIAQNASQIFEILTFSLLKEHVDYALELGLQGIPLPDIKHQPEIYFFDIVKSCNAIVHLYEKEFIDSVLPLIGGTPSFSECIERKRISLEQVEIKLDTGIDRSIETITGWVKIILNAEQNRKEFFKSETFNDNETPNMVSQASIKIVRFINAQAGKIKDSMDGKNVEAVLTELGIRFHRVIYEYLLQFQYSEVGALSIMCDVGEYRKCVKEFKIPLINQMFDTLLTLCNLLIVLPKDLNRAFHSEELEKLDISVRMNFVQLRTDSKAVRVHITQMRN